MDHERVVVASFVTLATLVREFAKGDLAVELVLALSVVGLLHPNFIGQALSVQVVISEGDQTRLVACLVHLSHFSDFLVELDRC